MNTDNNTENVVENEEAVKVDENETVETPELTLEEQLEKANEKIEELNDKYLRQVAEFDNYRKRVIKEKAELIKNGGEKIITNILPILDDFERAEANIEKMEDIASLKEGVKLIIEKFYKLMKQEGLEKMDVKGKNFDTDFHEAIAMIPGQSDEMKGKVVDCVMAGYTLNDKVIRHAKVAVAE
jgi:molecular chaperone GrpE